MPMTPGQRDAFLAGARIASLATLNPDGSPTAVPIWFDWDGSIARFFTSASSPKLRRIDADPRVALTIAEPAGLPETWVTIEGVATVHQEGAFELATRLAHRYYTAVHAETTLEAWSKIAGRFVLVAITPSRIRSSEPPPS